MTRLPASLPLRARVLGTLAVLLWLAAVYALAADAQAGRPPWIAASFVTAVGAALFWVLADAPLRYERDGDSLTVVTRLRRVSVPWLAEAPVSGVGKDLFAINGGFGWYGWFRVDGRVARAWVTDPACTVLVETGGRAVLISPSSALSVRMSPLLRTVPLGAPPWPTLDPFLFCVHHLDAYGPGNAHMGPTSSLAGRELGQDFAGKDGWSMYHGKTVPGFPSHPHRGFETVTVARSGYIDHSDSLGAAARFGRGDAQWMTAGDGIVHSEMFPLVRQDGDNPAELFQIWINLPGRSKRVPPHFSMLWNESIPVVASGPTGQGATVTVVAGALVDAKPPPPPPHSWAADAANHVWIWTIRLDAGATFTIPAAVAGLNRVLYFFSGSALTLDGIASPANHALQLRSELPATLVAGSTCELLLLQGRPIGEPVAQHGPFVMNTAAEIQEAFADYRRTNFGGWPWPASDPVHPRDEGRFARHADGRIERPIIPA